MQRTKASVSVEVRQVIEGLCRLLAATGLEAVPPPETFRRAKFGGGREVEVQFWQLLANILQRTSIVPSEASTRPTESELRKLVVAGLRQTGFHADWMYEREAGHAEEGCFSSRDLLLALGWLLATGTPEKLLTQQVQQLDKTQLSCIPVNSQDTDGLQLDLASLRKLQWLTGYLRHQRRILLSMLEERTRLLHAVVSASLSSSVSSSTDHSSSAIKEDCGRLRQLCDILEAYLNWKQVEHVFWTWMDSVVDCHLTDVVKKSVQTLTVCHHRDRVLEKTEDMLSTLPTAQAYRVLLDVERPVRDHIYDTERLPGGSKAPGKLPACQAARMLLQTEALLLDRRDRQRLSTRMQLQDLISELEGLVLIPP